MFIGHFAVGFAAKRFAPRPSLAPLLAAPLLLDLLWPWFLLFGWERVRIDPGNTRFVPLDLVYFPWSHSLLMSVVWATVFALIYHLIAQYWPGTLAIWIGVVSHWVLDWITHRPDMPLYPGGPRLGLGLWNSIAGTMVVEILLLAVGVWLYVRTTRPHRPVLVHHLLLFYCWRFTSAIASVPLPPVPDIVWGSIPWEPVPLLWAWWFDRHRVLRSPVQ